MANPPNRETAASGNLTAKQREERKRNEREGGAEDESTDSDADRNVGKDDPSKRGGTKERGVTTGHGKTNDRRAQQEDGGGGGYAEEREDTDEANGAGTRKSADKDSSGR